MELYVLSAIEDVSTIRYDSKNYLLFNSAGNRTDLSARMVMIEEIV